MDLEGEIAAGFSTRRGCLVNIWRITSYRAEWALDKSENHLPHLNISSHFWHRVPVFNGDWIQPPPSSWMIKFGGLASGLAKALDHHQVRFVYFPSRAVVITAIEWRMKPIT